MRIVLTVQKFVFRLQIVWLTEDRYKKIKSEDQIQQVFKRVLLPRDCFRFCVLIQHESVRNVWYVYVWPESVLNVTLPPTT